MDYLANPQANALVLERHTIRRRRVLSEMATGYNAFLPANYQVNGCIKFWDSCRPAG
jgi:hypothetical protein